MKKIFGRIIKALVWIVASVVILLVAVALLIQIPSIQNRITQKAVSFLEERIGTRVALGRIAIGFPKSIRLFDIYLEDRAGDTLVYAGRLSVDTDLFALTRKEIQLNTIELENTAGFVSRAASDSAFNFSYIIDAFATDSTAAPDTLEQESWKISLETLQLQDIRLRFDDSLMGNFASLSLGMFELDMRTFDLESSSFDVAELVLENSRVTFRQTQRPSPDNETDAQQSEDSVASPQFSLDQLSLKNVSFEYEQSATGVYYAADVGDLRILADKIDFTSQEIALNRLTLNESRFVARIDTVASLPADTLAPADPETTPWKISLSRLDLTDNSIEYTVGSGPWPEGVFAPNHVVIAGFTADIRDIVYDTKIISAEISNLAFRERSGFQLQSTSGRIKLGDNTATVDDFSLLTGHSRLNLEIDAKYASLADISETWPKTQLTSTINDTYIGVADLLYFNPTVLDSLPLNVPPASRLHIDAATQGSIDNLRIRHLNFRSLADTYVNASGLISGLPDTDKLHLDLSLEQFHTTAKDIEGILADSLLPDSIQIPASINLTARYVGSLKAADFSARLTSDAGLVESKGSINLDSTSSTRGSNVSLNVEDLDVGGILGKPDSVMGSLTMHATLETHGLAPEEMDGKLLLEVDDFSMNNYHYRDLKVEGTIADKIASASLILEDDNIDLAVDASYIFTEEVPRYDLTVDLRKADFHALNLTTRPIQGRGTLDVDLATSDFRVLNGNVGIRKVAVFDGDDLYAVDSLLFASLDQEGRSEITIDSDLFSARFEGSVNIFGLPGVMKEYFNSYFSLHDSLDVADAPPQHFRFNIELRNTDLITNILIPELTKFDPGPIQGEFDSRSRTLDVSMSIDAIQYGNIGVKAFSFTTDSDQDEFRYNFDIDRITVDSTRIDGLALHGKVSNDVMATEFIVFDSADHDKYVLSGNLKSLDNGTEVRLSPNGIILNYERWLVPENNFMRFGTTKFVAQQVELSKGDEKIIIHSDETDGSPITVGFRKLALEYLTSMVAEERIATGLLDGDFKLYTSTEGTAFASDLSLTDLKLRDYPWGDISLHVEQDTENRFDVAFALSGNENDVKIDGYYVAGEAPTMNLKAAFNRFDLQSLQPLLMDQVRDLKGRLQGELIARGTTQQPDINGQLTVNNTSFFSNFLNTAFSVDDETIAFVDEGIAFDRFEVADPSGNTARLDGEILTRDYRDFRFRLDLSTDNFRLLDTKKGDNDMFYGRIDINANAKVRGDIELPVVDVTIGFSEGTNLTYIVPQSEASAMQAEGIVKFVDRSFESDPFMKEVEHELSDTVKSTFTGIDLTARIELTDQESFTIIIDPVTQDQLTMRGNSTLTLQMDPTGDMNLTGRIEIEEGTYNLSFYKFVKREFQIEKGSSITWLGDPLNAQMDIHAIFNLETSPIELFANQLAGTDASQANQYRQRLPFMVYLDLSGELLQPEIGFRLDMPMANRNAFGGSVYARLMDINTRESDLNKQVFALLILKRFISDDPFENRAGGGFQSAARTSVSKILSDQLNRLSQNIKGVELSFDVKSYEDYTSGQAQGQTELQLGVSKSLFNDRLVVKLSGNIDVEGQNANRQPSDYIGDLALEYKITSDGRFRITGFRNSNYDMIDGELIETGTGLIYVKDYNSLSELFKANAPKKN